MKTSTPSFLAAAVCLASIALFAQDSVSEDHSAITAPVVLPAVVVQGFTSDPHPVKQPTPAPSPTRYFLSETDHALNRFTLPLFGRTPEQRALARFREDQRLEHLTVLKERVAFLEQTDPAAAKELKNDLYSLALRADSLPTPMSLAALR